jgi:hypothetical protein
VNPTAYVLHNINLPNSRLVVSHDSKTLMVGFPSISMAHTFSRLVLRDYRFHESTTPVKRNATCSKVRMNFLLEKHDVESRLLAKQLIIPMTITDYEHDHTLFLGMTRHEIDFLLIRKFMLNQMKNQLQIQGIWVEFNGDMSAIDPVDLFEHNKKALDFLFQL